jgi:hypothetical protein
MKTLMLALAALFTSTAAVADTLISNVNGVQVGADGQIQHFSGLLIGDDGRVRSVLTGPPPPKRFEHEVNGEGRTLLPGLIDAHGHVLGLGYAAMTLDLNGSKSLQVLQQRLQNYGSSGAVGTRNCGREGPSPPRPTSMPSSATVRWFSPGSMATPWLPTAPRCGPPA